jgi:hypothetical protein
VQRLIGLATGRGYVMESDTKAGNAGLEEHIMNRAKNATLVFCLFVVYCVLLSQGLKAGAVSAFFGALAAVPLTVHLYCRRWPLPPEKDAGYRERRQRVRRDAVDAEPEYVPSKVDGRVGHTD